LNPEPVEIRSDPARVRVAFVEGSIPEEFRAEESLELRGGGGDDAVDAFGMKVAAKTLKMGREQRGIGVVDLPGRVASASLGPTYNGMYVFDLIERIGAFASPFRQGIRGHSEILLAGIGGYILARGSSI
jgi:hypothetical protein